VKYKQILTTSISIHDTIVSLKYSSFNLIFMFLKTKFISHT
jgi:hypothetical protein